MAKKNVEKAIQDAHDSADKAIDEAQKDLREARQDLFAWLGKEYTFTRLQLLVVGTAAVVAIASLLLL